MTISYWIILIVSLFLGAIVLEAYLKRGRRSKPLHEIFNATDATETSQTPLGMEAMDIEGFEQTNQFNDNLARHTGVQMKRNSKSNPHAPIKKRSAEDHAKIFIPKDKN
mgnify:CR=1 FL=1